MTNNRPWVRKYDPEVPAALEYPETTIQDFLIQQAINYPKRSAIVYSDSSITYEDLLIQARRFANNLIRLGLKLGDRVGICLPNIPQFVTAYYGILMAGGIVAAMNPAYPQCELDFQAGIVKPRFLIGLEQNGIVLSEITSKQQIDKLILLNRINETASGNNVVSGEKIFSFSRMLIDCNNVDGLPSINPDQPAVFQFSGGTTGIPKAAVGLHRNVAANVIQFKQWLTTMKDGEEIFLTAIPLYHVYGMVIGLNVGIAMGATIVLVSDPRDLSGMLHQIQKYAVTFFPGVPSIYHAINQFPPVKNGEFDLRTIKACISGSAPLLQETKIQFEKLTGGKLVEGYGLSEAPTATHCNPINGENRNGSIGLPLPDVDCKIVDLEDNSKELKIGEAGELLIRGPQIMKEYYQQPDETSLVLREGWLCTGDIAKMDKDGYFYIVGRRKELIKVNGLQVWPTEVEEVLIKHPSIKETAVAGIPDPAHGEIVKAWVVLNDSASIDLLELQAHCRFSLAGYKIPKQFEIIDSLPKTFVGKVLRRELVQEHLEKIKKQGA